MDAYHVYEQIGTGNRSTIYKTRLKKTLNYYAIKRTLKQQPLPSHQTFLSSSSSNAVHGNNPNPVPTVGGSYSVPSTEKVVIAALSYEIIQHLKCLGITDLTPYLVESTTTTTTTTITDSSAAAYPEDSSSSLSTSFLPSFQIQPSFTLPSTIVYPRYGHPNILHLHHWSTSVRSIYRVYEYCSGGSLAKVIEQDQGLPEAAIRLFSMDIVKAIHYLHSKGYLYGPIRLQNIMLDENGTLKLCNFSNVTEYGKDETLLIPTEHFFRSNQENYIYLAPELLPSHGITPSMIKEDSLRSTIHSSPLFPPIRSIAADLWSLGVCLYEIATGGVPFPSIDTILHDKVPYPQIPQLGPSTLSTIIEETKSNDDNEEKSNKEGKESSEEKQNTSFDDEQFFDDSLVPSTGTRRGPCSRTFFHLLTRLLDKDPQKRCTWKELLCHPFWQNDMSVNIDEYSFHHQPTDRPQFSEWIPLYDTLSTFPSEKPNRIPVSNAVSIFDSASAQESKDEGNDPIIDMSVTKEKSSSLRTVISGVPAVYETTTEDVSIIDQPDYHNDSVQTNDTIVRELIPLRYSTTYEQEFHRRERQSQSIEPPPPYANEVSLLHGSTNQPVTSPITVLPFSHLHRLLYQLLKRYTDASSLIKPIAATGKPPPLRLSTLPFAPLSIDELVSQDSLPEQTHANGTTIPSIVQDHLSIISRSLQTSEPVITLSILSYIYSLCESDIVSNHAINSNLTTHLLRMLPESPSTTVQARIALLIGRFIQRATFITPSVIYDHHLLATLNTYLSSTFHPSFHPTVHQHLTAAYCELIFYIATQAHQEPNDERWYIPSYAVDTIQHYITFGNCPDTVIFTHFLQLIGNILSLAPKVLFTLSTENRYGNNENAEGGPNSILPILYETLGNRVMQQNHPAESVNDAVSELNNSNVSSSIAVETENTLIVFILQILFVWLQQQLEQDTIPVTTVVPSLSIDGILAQLYRCVHRSVDNRSFTNPNVPLVIFYSSLALLTNYVRNGNDTTTVPNRIFTTEYYGTMKILLENEAVLDPTLLNSYAVLSSLLLHHHQNSVHYHSPNGPTVDIHEWLLHFPSWMNRLVTRYRHEQLHTKERISLDNLDNSQDDYYEQNNEHTIYFCIRLISTTLLYDALVIGNSTVSSANEDIASLILDTCTATLAFVPAVMFIDWIDLSFCRAIDYLLQGKRSVIPNVGSFPFSNWDTAYAIWIGEIFRTFAESFEIVLEKNDSVFPSNETDEVFLYYQTSLFPTFIHWFSLWVSSLRTGTGVAYNDIYPSLLQSLYQFFVSSPLLLSRMLISLYPTVPSTVVRSLCALYKYIDKEILGHAETDLDDKDGVVTQSTIAELLYNILCLLTETNRYFLSTGIPEKLSIDTVQCMYDFLEDIRFPFMDTVGLNVKALSRTNGSSKIDKDYGDEESSNNRISTLIRSDWYYGLTIVRIIDTLTHMTVQQLPITVVTDTRIMEYYSKLSRILNRVLKWWDSHVRWLLCNPNHSTIYNGTDRYTVLSIVLQNMSLLLVTIFRTIHGNDEQFLPPAVSEIRKENDSLYTRRILVAPQDQVTIPASSVLRTSTSSTTSTASTEIADPDNEIHPPENLSENNDGLSTTFSFDQSSSILDSFGDQLTTMVTSSLTILIHFNHRLTNENVLYLVKNALRYLQLVNYYVPIKASFQYLFWTETNHQFHQHTVDYLRIMDGIIPTQGGSESNDTRISKVSSSFYEFLPILENFVMNIDTVTTVPTESMMIAYMDVFLSCIRTSTDILRIARKYFVERKVEGKNGNTEGVPTIVDRLRTNLLGRKTSSSSSSSSIGSGSSDKWNALSTVADDRSEERSEIEIRKPIFIRVRRGAVGHTGIPTVSSSASVPLGTTVQALQGQGDVNNRRESDNYLPPSVDLRKRLECLIKELQ